MHEERSQLALTAMYAGLALLMSTLGVVHAWRARGARRAAGALARRYLGVMC